MLAALLLTLGCGRGAPDTAGAAAGCSADSECSEWAICDQGTCVAGDRNSSPGEAEPLVWEREATGWLQTGGDVDYYSFSAEGGEYVRISTEPLGDEADIDTVLTLYTPSGTVHAREDEHPAGPVVTYDSVLYAWLPEGGTWIVAVESADGRASTETPYALLLRETGAHTRESDSRDDPSYVLQADGAGVYWAIGVVLEQPGDVDWIRVSLPWDDCPVSLYGSSSLQGTAADPAVELLLPDGTPLLRKEGLGPAGSALYPEVDGGTVLLAASDAMGGGGDDYWFFVYVSIGERGYSYGREHEPNDGLDTAEPLDLSWETGSEGQVGTATAWGTVDDPGDEDWFSFELDPGALVHVYGSADSLGSYADMRLELLDQDGALLGESTHGDDTFPDISNVGPVAGGTSYLRLVQESGAGAGPGWYYRFAVYVTDYPVSD